MLKSQLTFGLQDTDSGVGVGRGSCYALKQIKTHPHGLAHCILYSIHHFIYLIINFIYLFPKLVIVCVGTLVFLIFKILKFKILFLMIFVLNMND